MFIITLLFTQAIISSKRDTPSTQVNSDLMLYGSMLTEKLRSSSLNEKYHSLPYMKGETVTQVKAPANWHAESNLREVLDTSKP